MLCALPGMFRENGSRVLLKAEKARVSASATILGFSLTGKVALFV